MKIAFCFLFLNSFCSCYHILYVQHLPSYSQFVICERIVQGLLLRGHNVTVVSPFRQKSPAGGLKEIVLDKLGKGSDEDAKSDPLSTPRIFMDLIKSGGKFVLENEKVEKGVLKSGVKFDLVILHLLGDELLLGLSYYFKVPFVLVRAFGQPYYAIHRMGATSTPAYIPDNIFIKYLYEMNFSQRVENFINFVQRNLYYTFVKFPKLNREMQEFFPGAPPITELYYNASFHLINSHPSISASLPTVNNALDIGGIHISDRKPLPESLKVLLDEAKQNGVIYFSLGTNVPSKSLSDEIKSGILRSFAKLEQTVLWKFNDTELKDKPGNVIVRKWFPQQDVLAHPNVKLFITHGGVLSVIEAIHFGVPMIGIPFFGDQHLNMMEAVQNGYAYGLPFEDLNEDNLDKVIKEMLSNKTYSLKIKEKSAIFRDRPWKPLDCAIYWIEYVIRHKGAVHLKSISLKLNWFQIQTIDILAFFFTLFYILLKIISMIFVKFCKRVRKIKKQ